MSESNITIPPGALRAARAAFMNARGDGDDQIRAACIAMLKAWETDTHRMIVGTALDEVGGTYPAIILPLTEKQNDKG